MKSKVLFLLLMVVAGGLIIFSFHADIPVEELKKKYGGPPSEYVAVSGMEVHYRDEGLAEDTLPLVLLHGTSSSLHTWDGWVDGLKDNHRVIRLDLPGFGLTGPFPDGNYGMAHYVSFLHSFLEKLGVRRCIIAGNSLGGQIAWSFVAEYPHLATKLVLIDAAGIKNESYQPPLAFRVARIPVVKHSLAWLTPRPLARKSVEDVYAIPARVDDKLVDRYFELTLREGNRKAMIDRLNWPEDLATPEQLSRLSQPVLILWGRQDRLFPEACGRTFSDLLPHDTLVVLDGCGHVPMEECPEQSLQVLKSFLGKGL